MTSSSKFADHTAEAIRGLFDKGVNDPSVKRITAEYYQGVPFGNLEVSRVRRSLGGAVRILTEDYGETLHPVTGFYYTLPKKRGQRVIPEDTVSLRRCLPLTAGPWPAVGIRRVTSTDDRLYRESMSQGVALGAGAVRKIQEGQAQALRTGLLSEEAVRQHQRELLDGVLPDSPEDRQRILALTDGSSEASTS